jgi:hypothetical protein
MGCKPVLRASCKQLAVLGKVVVHREPLDPRAPGDLGHRGPSRAHLLVELGSGGDDPFPGVVLVLGTRSEFVLSLLT